MAFEADEVLRVLGVERRIDRMGGGGDQNVHRSGTNGATSAFDECTQFAVALGDLSINGKRAECRLCGNEVRESSRSDRRVECDTDAVVQFGEADGADGDFSVEFWCAIDQDARVKNCDGHGVPMDQ